MMGQHNWTKQQTKLVAQHRKCCLVWNKW